MRQDKNFINLSQTLVCTRGQNQV